MKYICWVLIISIISIIMGCKIEKEASFEMLERPYTCRDFGGRGIDVGQSCAICKDGSVLITGFTQSIDGDLKGVRDFTSKDKSSKHIDKDLWVLKIEPKEDKILYNKCFGGSKNDYGFSIAETVDENIIVTGYTESIDGDLEGTIINNLSPRSSKSLWILKIDPKKDKILYNKSLGESGVIGCGNSIAETKDGNIIITGEIQADEQLETFETIQGGYDLLVLMIDPKKDKILYKHCFGGKGDDRGFSIVESNDGHLIVAGTTNSVDGDLSGAGFHYGKYKDFNNKINIYPDIWLLKIDPKNDKILYNKCFGGSKFDAVNSAVKCSDDSIFIAGVTNSSNGHLFGQRIGSKNMDVWVLKVDITKDKILYNKCFVETGKNFVATVISQTKDNNILLAAIGISSTLVTEINPSLSSNKQIQYSRFFKEHASAIASTDDGKIVITGFENSSKYKSVNVILLIIEPPNLESP